MSEYSARPDNLAAFEPVSSSLDSDIVGAKSSLASAHGSFRANNQWGDVDASALLEGIEQFVMLNKGDATWVAEVGEAFRNADASGDVAYASSIMVDAKPSEHAGSSGVSQSSSDQLKKIYEDNREKALTIAEDSEREADRASSQADRLEVRIKELESEYEDAYAQQDADASATVWEIDQGRAELTALQTYAQEQSERAKIFRPLADPKRDFLQITDDAVPRVSEVHGDLATADNVTFLIPGTGTTAANYATAREDATNLLDGQNDADPARKHAVIDSLSYEAPTGHDVNPIDMAGDFGSDKFLDNASDEIAEFVESVPLPQGATINAVGHSYGSTALAKATLDHAIEWDNLVGAGSPGMVAEHAADFGADDVVMVAQRGDPITGVGAAGTGAADVLDVILPVLIPGNAFLDSESVGVPDEGRWGDPYDSEFGARQKGSYAPFTPPNFDRHSEYFLEDVGQLETIANVTTDQK